jgi:hypothetical protein
MTRRTALERRAAPLQVLKQSLGLSDEQVRNLEPVLERQQNQVTCLRTNTSLSRHDRLMRIQEIRATADGKLSQYLTPEQLRKWKSRTGQLQFRQSASVVATNRFATGGEVSEWQRPKPKRPPPPPPPSIGANRLANHAQTAKRLPSTNGLAIPKRTPAWQTPANASGHRLPPQPVPPPAPTNTAPATGGAPNWERQ